MAGLGMQRRGGDKEVCAEDELGGVLCAAWRYSYDEALVSLLCFLKIGEFDVLYS